MTTAVSHLTEADVIEAALEHFAKPRSFTDSYYFSNRSGAGPNPGATCALGGVEQALWNLTGRAVEVPVRQALRRGSRPVPRSRLNSLYARVIRRLNRITRELEFRDGPETLEEATLSVLRRTGRERVLRVLRLALEETRA